MKLQDLATMGSDMRTLQKKYFKLAREARKTNHPDVIAEKKKVLELSKIAERRFDAAIVEVKRSEEQKQQPNLF